jgi:hypothetical protein
MDRDRASVDRGVGAVEFTCPEVSGLLFPISQLIGYWYKRLVTSTYHYIFHKAPASPLPLRSRTFPAWTFHQ